MVTGVAHNTRVVTTPRPRMQRRMAEVIEYVRSHPGCTREAVARSAGLRIGRYEVCRVVERTIAASLIEECDSCLYLTELGISLYEPPRGRDNREIRSQHRP